MFYSQHGEDRWLSENLNLPHHGTFVEVGAADGRALSNTLWLEERGWHGIVIEPDERQYPALLRNRRCIVVAGAVGKVTTEGEQREMTFTAEPTHSGFLRDNGTRQLVPVWTLSQLLAVNRLPHVDVLSIDTEGTELEVWETLPPAIRPGVVIMEYYTEGLSTADNRPALRAALEPVGYRVVHETPCNLIFVR